MYESYLNGSTKCDRLIVFLQMLSVGNLIQVVEKILHLGTSKAV